MTSFMGLYAGVRVLNVTELESFAGIARRRADTTVPAGVKILWLSLLTYRFRVAGCKHRCVSRSKPGELR